MIKLFQFPISHYCEKARWALDYKQIPYQAINLIPGLHLKPTKKLGVRSSVPILQHNDKVVAGSSQIIDHLETLKLQNPLTFDNELLNKQVVDWEAILDSTAGINVRLAAYHVLLEHPEIVKPFFTHQGPWYGPLFVSFAFNKLSKTMRKLMNINQQTFESGKQSLHLLLDKLSEHYSHSEFLVGDRFSRADLTAAALFAPLVMPQGYGLNWPKKVPEDYQELLNEFSEKLSWVEPLYQKYR
jgi:glutathione S-transferase